MVLRLSELLERVRPAGAPGAPTEGDLQRRDAAEAEELADLAAVLRAFDDEADGVVAAARTEAARIRSDAEQRASRIRVELPDRIAAAQATTVEEHHRLDEDTRERVVADAQAQTEQLRRDFERRMPATVDRVIALVWDDIGPGEAAKLEASP